MDLSTSTDLPRACEALVSVFGALAGEAARNGRIALVGLRGAGKSTLGRGLAEGQGLSVVEPNRSIEAMAGCTLSEMHSLYGPASATSGVRARSSASMSGVLAQGDTRPMAGHSGSAETVNVLQRILASRAGFHFQGRRRFRHPQHGARRSAGRIARPAHRDRGDGVIRQRR